MMHFVSHLAPAASGLEGLAGDERAYWFIFQDDKLLVRQTGDRVLVPVISGPPELGLNVMRTVFLGHVEEDGKQTECYAAEVDVSAPLPDGMTFEGKRAPLVTQDHHFSASGLQSYSNCPAQYKFSNVLRVPSRATTYFQLGSVVHEVIERLTTQEREGTPPTKDRAYEMLEHFWSSAAYASKQKEAEDKIQAQQMLETYLAWNERNENEIIGAEMKFAFTLNGRSVTGFIDRVERTPVGEYVVLDYKTGYTTESRNSIKQNIQMNVYALAVLDKFGILPHRASLYYVKHDKMVDYIPTQDLVEEQKTRLSEMIDNVVLERFPGMPSFQTCRSCSYQALCEEKEHTRS